MFFVGKGLQPVVREELALPRCLSHESAAPPFTWDDASGQKSWGMLRLPPVWGLG